MNISQIYDYLIRTRRDLWQALENTPEEVLNQPLLKGSRFHCIKDLVFHIANVEDSWIQADIQQKQPILKKFPNLDETEDAPVFSSFTLETLLEYWQAVEQQTLIYLTALTDNELQRLVEDSPTEKYTVDGLIWHVMLHEIRHTAQIVALLRIQGIKPPSLDLLFYLPTA